MKIRPNEVEVTINGDQLYIPVPKSRFVPAYVYYLLEFYKCNKVTFSTSKKQYPKEILKGKEDWKEVDHELKQTS